MEEYCARGNPRRIRNVLHPLVHHAPRGQEGHPRRDGIRRLPLRLGDRSRQRDRVPVPSGEEWTNWTENCGEVCEKF